MSLPHALQVRTSRTQPPGAGLRPLLPPRATSQPPYSLGPHAGPSPGAPHLMANNAPRNSRGEREGWPTRPHVNSRCGGRLAPRRQRPDRPDPHFQAPPRPSAPGRCGPHPQPTFVAGAGQEGPERGAQEEASPEGGPARCGVAAGQRRGAAGGVAVARGPPASRTRGPRAPHLLLAASAAAVPRVSVHGPGFAEGAREARGAFAFPVGSLAFWRAALPNAGTAGPRRRPKFAPGPCLPPPRWGSH